MQGLGWGHERDPLRLLPGSSCAGLPGAVPTFPGAVSAADPAATRLPVLGVPQFRRAPGPLWGSRGAATGSHSRGLAGQAHRLRLAQW